VSAALAALGLVVAGQAIAAGNVSSRKPAPSLDRFDDGYGFPTYPAAGNGEVRQVPFIYYGGDVNALRLNDVPKIHLEVRPVRHR